MTTKEGKMGISLLLLPSNRRKSFSSPLFYSKQILISFLVVVLWVYCLIPNTLFAQQKKQQKLYDDLFSVSFPTEKDGWACGRWGTVLHTEDSGKTWVRQNTGTEYTLSSIFFVDPQKGWAVGDGGIIINTTDGGKTWQKQKSQVPFFLMKVHFKTPLKGWIVSEQTHILYTEDGGKTWTIQFRGADFILQSISFCDFLNGWAVGEYGYIYHTKDGGATWNKQAGYFGLSKETGNVVGGPFLFDVVAIDPRTAWTVGIDSYVIKTEDGGKTWQKVETGVPRTQLYCVDSDKKDKILIGGKGVFLSSTDRGKTWKNPAFEPPITYGWVNGLSRQGSSGFVTVGWDGAIYLLSSSASKRVNY